MRAVALLIASHAAVGAFGQEQGFWPVLGGMPYGAGLALGVEYRHSRLLGGEADFRARVIGSHRKYEHGEAWLSFPRLARGWLFAELTARYRNYPEENFFGLGPKSPSDQRTSYRLEDFRYAGSAGVNFTRWLRAGLTAGRTCANTGPGKKKRYPSIERLFDPAAVPALAEQPDYYQAGVFLRIDYRDQESSPSSGGFYEARLTYHGDLDFGRYSFRRYEVELRQFVPVAGERHVLAARALASLSGTSPGQEVPFFLQPTAGGGGDLRGFDQYRFRDRHAAIFNLEYRRQMNAYFDLVGFADAGRVFRRGEQFTLSGLEASAGFGGRVKFRRRVLLGLDVGFSREGVHLWFRSSHLF